MASQSGTLAQPDPGTSVTRAVEDQVNLALAEGATWKDVQLMMVHWLRCGLPVSDEAMSKLVDCCIGDVRFYQRIPNSFWDLPIRNDMLAPCVQLVTSTVSLRGRKPSARLLKETARKLIKLGDGASAVQLFCLIDKLYPDYNGLPDPAPRRRAAPARAARGGGDLPCSSCCCSCCCSCRLWSRILCSADSRANRPAMCAAAAAHTVTRTPQ